MKKLVIANSGKSKQGKSTSIRKVFDLLQQKYPDQTDVKLGEEGGDIKAIITIKGFKIGIESQGDPTECSRMENSVNDFIKEKCDIIVVACRTPKSKTYKKVCELKDKGYEIIWASNDRLQPKTDEALIEKLNTLYAERVVKMIEDRIASKI
ncbi:hypothetical protein [Capnocytophaga cynodegmi]|uniref:hypothetical protein n=1 Tax=Capnocytophaga cynodegmi TaxID=28189 RepID=UPI00385F0ACE